MKPITPSYDPWEAYMDLEEYGKLLLTNVEFTTTTLCNMRCEHCAVGYTLQPKDPNPLPMDLLLKRLDEIPHLRSLSITGGEPMLSKIRRQLCNTTLKIRPRTRCSHSNQLKLNYRFSTLRTNYSLFRRIAYIS